tara:strand:- start:451 stop:1107 length:657 start_codon:yes stop_codon:yes gene_type:complete
MDNTERRITALHPRLSATYDGATWSGVPGLNGWSVLDLANTQFAHETVIDLSGYAMESLTFFPNSLGIQDPGVYLVRGTADPTFSGIQVLDVITSVPMDLAAVSSLQVQGAGPGMLESDYEFETILFGMYRFFSTNLNVPYTNYVQLERSQRFDSGEPTAADKLYCYRIVNLLVTGLDPESRVTIPACRQLIAGTMSAEPELVYMQRLKRSYELANQV